jgi:hypothetical protein
MALTILVTAADGREYRFGADEPDPGFVPFGITWESVVPGGWKSAQFNLRRRIDEDAPLRLLDEVEILDEHNVPMFEGRIARLPRQHGQDFLLGVECVGWAAHLLDDKTFREIYVDRDLSRWGDVPLSRKAALVGGVFAVPGGWSVGANTDPSSPGIAMTTEEIQQTTNRLIAETWYDAQGVAIGEIAYELSCKNLGSASWVTQASLVDDETVTSFNAGTDHDGAVGPTGGNVVASGVPKYYAILNTYYNASLAATRPDGGFSAIWRRIAVFGTHGMADHADPVTGEGGYYIHEILADALPRAAPKLNFTTGPDGSIQNNPLTLIQVAYHDPQSVENVILDLNKYVLWDWGVERNRTFFFRPTDPDRLTWEARLDQGVHLSLEGDDAERAYNGAVVKYTNAGGKVRVAGPTGSGFDVESALLTDSSADNTVNAHGYPAKHIDINVSFPLGSDDLAVSIGSAYLAQASLPSRSGTITLTGDVGHPTKGPRPSREIFAGEWIRLSDHPADVPRRVLSARHDDDSKTTSVTVGNDINKVDAMLEQLGVVTGLVGG